MDVFADIPYAGNSVTVFLTEGTVATGQMLAITQEFRHFESIFLWPAATDGRWRARVFDLEGELDFAGHPVLGAAVALHDRAGCDTTRQWTIELSAKTVTVQTTRDGNMFRATLDQGRPVYGPSVTGAASRTAVETRRQRTHHIATIAMDPHAQSARITVVGVTPPLVRAGTRPEATIDPNGCPIASRASVSPGCTAGAECQPAARPIAVSAANGTRNFADAASQRP